MLQWLLIFSMMIQTASLAALPLLKYTIGRVKRYGYVYGSEMFFTDSSFWSCIAYSIYDYDNSFENDISIDNKEIEYINNFNIKSSLYDDGEFSDIGNKQTQISIIKKDTNEVVVSEQMVSDIEK